MTSKVESSVIVKSFLKTSAILVLALCFIVTIYLGAFPRSYSKLADELKLGNVSISGYERIYSASGEYTDLYNLICVCAKYENMPKLESYTQKFIEDNSPQKAEFVQKLDASALKTTKNADYAYVASVENYVLNCLVRAKFAVYGADEAFAVATNFNDNLLCFQLGTYVDLIVDNFAGQEKTEKVLDVYNFNYAGKSFEEFLNYKISVIDAKIETLTDCLTNRESLLVKLALLSTKIQVLQTKLEIFVGVNESLDMNTKIANVEQKIGLCNIEYNNLVEI